MKIPSPKFEQIQTSFWSPPRFRLVDDWVILLDDGLPLVFLRGFETDFASTPRLMWSIPGFSPFGVLLTGSIPHDNYYQYGYFLTFYEPHLRQYYPEASLSLQDQFPDIFTNYIPVFVGRGQDFADFFMQKVTIEKTGAKFVANCAEFALGKFGGKAWGRYRELGPTAYNSNSLGLPGITNSGVAF